MASDSHFVRARSRGTNPLAALVLVLIASCSRQTSVRQVDSPPPQRPAPMTENPQLAIPVAAGSYRCEQSLRVEIKPDSRDANRIDVGWQGQRYSLTRHNSYSGLPRFEDSASQLVWVVLPWKSLLLDGRSGQPLANECKPG